MTLEEAVERHAYEWGRLSVTLHMCPCCDELLVLTRKDSQDSGRIHSEAGFIKEQADFATELD